MRYSIVVDMQVLLVIYIVEVEMKVLSGLMPLSFYNMKPWRICRKERKSDGVEEIN